LQRKKTKTAKNLTIVFFARHMLLSTKKGKFAFCYLFPNSIWRISIVAFGGKEATTNN
jgi:hypothetical protein